MAEPPLVYLVLGAVGSGRREILADLVADGLDSADRAALLLSTTEPAHELDASLPLGPRWSWEGGDAPFEVTIPDDATHVFVVADGRRNPIDQIEAFKMWLSAGGRQVGRIFCVVNCQLGEKHPALLAWYEACIHFSDVVLLNRREGVANKWMSDFLGHFKKLYYPALFETVKAGRVANPVALLEPEARRMSHAFDEDQDWIFTNSDGEVIDEDEETDDEEIEAIPAEDPYFARRPGGRRMKEIPDIGKILTAGE